MLPILPAILILLFQGPANLQKLALEGRLPSAIQAIQRSDQPVTRAEQEAIAHLLAAAKHPELSRALLSLVQWATVSASSPGDEAVAVPRTLVKPINDPTPNRFLCARSQRSRDGPVSDC